MNYGVDQTQCLSAKSHSPHLRDVHRASHPPPPLVVPTSLLPIAYRFMLSVIYRGSSHRRAVVLDRNSHTRLNGVNADTKRRGISEIFPDFGVHCY